jgi:FixJ family two-component response regulator
MSCNRTWRVIPASLNSGERALQRFRDSRANSLVEHRFVAMRLVATLDTTETQIPECLVRRISAKDTGALIGICGEKVERSRTSMMEKLNAKSSADGVRIGLYAGIDLLN